MNRPSPTRRPVHKPTLKYEGWGTREVRAGKRAAGTTEPPKGGRYICRRGMKSPRAARNRRALGYKARGAGGKRDYFTFSQTKTKEANFPSMVLISGLIVSVSLLPSILACLTRSVAVQN
jgi:hypothetical protein